MGRIGKPHGVKGDIFVSLTSDVEQRRSVGAEFVVMVANEPRTLRVSSVRTQGDRYVMHFEGVDDRTAAEHLTNKFLFAEPVVDESALWVHELIGSRVVDDAGEEWGTCVAVVDNPAHQLLELEDGVLVPLPFVESCDGAVTRIRPPEGLREALRTQ